ncbi:prolyl endopeptidase-like isoform X2 [Hibiscus syriacus]|uniref:Prolyl endopeptidase n=1 Tax=Hibiscus syriacus TaxID=106335 RepID=A0A6A3CCV9_HIBSY|nr:prolyl endopeptidase-like isoform X2 [Hibiscus syriacus]
MFRHLTTIVRHCSTTVLRHQNNRYHRSTSYRHPKTPNPPSPPKPPKAPQKPQTFTFHDVTWEDPYSWMSSLQEKVAMRHMDMYMEQEEKYTEAVMSDTERLQTKLQSEMASRLNFDLSTPPVRWGPWLYYRRVEEGKQYPVLCRRLASLNEEFISHKSPSFGFDFTSGKRIEQKLLDYNQEAERFGGYAYEELSEISPDHKFLAYTMYDKDNDYFKLSVRNLNSGALCSKPHANHVSNLAWIKDGQALLYVVTDENKRPYRIYCSMIGSTDEDVFLINAADPFSGMALAWESEGIVHCILEHHQGYFYLFTDASKNGQTIDNHYLLRSPVDSSSNPRIWENVFIDSKDLVIEDVDFCKSHLVLITREGRTHGICSVALPLPDGKQAVHLQELQPYFLTLPKHVCNISPGPNYDYYSTTMRFTISSPVMPDAVVDYDCGGGGGKKWHHDGRRTKKQNSIRDYISCAKYLIEKEIVQENKLAGWGYSVGGLLVASAINCCPDLFRAAVLKVPFLDATNTLLYPILPLAATDYEEFGYPVDIDEFYAIRKISPYDNIQKDALYPAVLVSSSFNTRFGVWEAAKWVARVREQTIYDPKHPILLNLMTDIVEENRYLQCKESAMETAFLIKAMDE